MTSLSLPPPSTPKRDDPAPVVRSLELSASLPPLAWRMRRAVALAWHALWPAGLVLAMVLAVVALGVCTAGCAGTQRDVCTAIGGTLKTVAALLQEQLTAELVAAPDAAAEDAVDAKWEPVLAAYETVAAAQNAWADALERGEEYPIGAVQAAWCAARAERVPLPDWPLGGCP